MNKFLLGMIGAAILAAGIMIVALVAMDGNDAQAAQQGSGQQTGWAQPGDSDYCPHCPFHRLPSGAKTCPLQTTQTQTQAPAKQVAPVTTASIEQTRTNSDPLGFARLDDDAKPAVARATQPVATVAATPVYYQVKPQACSCETSQHENRGPFGRLRLFGRN